MRKAKSKTILLSLMLGIGVLQPFSAFAQFEWLHGLFGRGEEAKKPVPTEEMELDGVMIENLEGLEDYGSYERGLFKRGEASSNGLFNQGFGETPTGITIEPFDNNGPVGSGLFIMLISGAGYAVLKKRKTNESNQ